MCSSESVGRGGRGKKKKSDFVVCAPVFASRHKQLPLLPLFDACGDRCSPRGSRNICKTFHKKGGEKKDRATRDQYRSLITDCKRGT